MKHFSYSFSTTVWPMKMAVLAALSTHEWDEQRYEVVVAKRTSSMSSYQQYASKHHGNVFQPGSLAEFDASLHQYHDILGVRQILQNVVTPDTFSQ